MLPIKGLGCADSAIETNKKIKIESKYIKISYALNWSSLVRNNFLIYTHNWAFHLSAAKHTNTTQIQITLLVSSCFRCTTDEPSAETFKPQWRFAPKAPASHVRWSRHGCLHLKRLPDFIPHQITRSGSQASQAAPEKTRKAATKEAPAPTCHAKGV